MESESSIHNSATVEAQRRRERHRVRARERRQAMSIEEREDYLARRRRYYQNQVARLASTETLGQEATSTTLPTNSGIITQVMESESSTQNLAEVERRREKDRVRARERRQAMSIEERENYLARRRRCYQNKRARIASTETLGQEATSSTLSSNSASSVHRGDTRRSHLIHLIYSTSVPNMIPANQCQGSTLCASTSHREGSDRYAEMTNDGEPNSGYNSPHEDNSCERRPISGRTDPYCNCARDSHERHQIPRLQLPTPTICEHCRAKLPINSRALVVSDPSALKNVGQNSSFSREDVQNGMHSQHVEAIVNHSKKLQDDLQELGAKIKHHEENVKYLKNLKNRLEDSILDMQVAIGKYHTRETEDPAYVECEKETIQHILKYEKSAAAILCSMKSKPDAQANDHPLVKDVLGIIATLGKVDDANLSRLLSEYLGLETMLAVVCKTYEGVKALEAYTKDGLINRGLGIHAFAAADDKRLLDDRFLVICLENLRPYAGEFIADDPQRRLDLLKPRLHGGETPPGFLGFAVNMVTIDNTNLYCISKAGYSLRETLFYNLFSSLQVYRSREDMLKALPSITNGAISLDGGVIRSPGIFLLGHHRGDIDVKFPCDSKRSNRPVSYFEIENRLKETKWKKDRAWEDLQREQTLLDHAKFTYETRKREFLQFLAESSSHATQFQAGSVSTPR